jgi:hypothetical protein
MDEDRFHRYHLFNCQTLQRMESIGRSERYRMASRTDGRFTYTVRRRDRVVREYRGENGVNLLFCRNCLGIYEEHFSRRRGHPFSLHDFMTDSSDWTNAPRGRRFDHDDIPDVYAADWNLISTRAKHQRGYRCEECAIELSAPHLRKYLHAHHIDSQRANSIATNLRVLCIAHHAEQPLHAHLRRLREYQEFVQTFKRRSIGPITDFDWDYPRGNSHCSVVRWDFDVVVLRVAT